MCTVSFSDLAAIYEARDEDFDVSFTSPPPLRLPHHRPQQHHQHDYHHRHHCVRYRNLPHGVSVRSGVKFSSSFAEYSKLIPWTIPDSLCTSFWQDTGTMLLFRKWFIARSLVTFPKMSLLLFATRPSVHYLPTPRSKKFLVGTSAEEHWKIIRYLHAAKWINRARIT